MNKNLAIILSNIDRKKGPIPLLIRESYFNSTIEGKGDIKHKVNEAISFTELSKDAQHDAVNLLARLLQKDPVQDRQEIVDVVNSLLDEFSILSDEDWFSLPIKEILSFIGSTRP